MGNVGHTYNAPLRKFIMILSQMDERDFFDTIILESDAIDSEYKVVQYLKGFATASFLNIPSRFISEDGRTMWLSYSSKYHYKNNPQSTIGGPGHIKTDFIPIFPQRWSALMATSYL